MLRIVCLLLFSMLSSSECKLASPSFRLDGRQIVFVRNQRIWVVNSDGTGARELQREGANGYPSFRPDGQKIVFVRSGQGSASDIWTMNSDGSGSARLTSMAGTVQFPTYPADGKSVVFVASEGSEVNAYRVDVAKGTLTKLFAGVPVMRVIPRPDGENWIVCRGGHLEGGKVTGGWAGSLLIGLKEGSPEARYVDAPSGEVEDVRVAWNTGKIALLERDGSRSGARVRVELPEHHSLTLEMNPSKHAGFDISPDGKTLVDINDAGADFCLGSYDLDQKDGGEKKIVHSITTLTASEELEEAEKFAKLGMAAPALQACTRAISLEPAWPYGYRYRARLYYLSHQLNEAAADYSKVIELQPANPGPLSDRGTIYLRLEKFRQAADDFGRAIGLNPKVAKFYLGRAAAYEKLGKLDLAAADKEQARKLEAKAP